MKPGISLLDVLVAVALASIMSILIYRSLEQTTRMVKNTDVMIDAYTGLVLFANQVEKDINSIFVPQAAIKKNPQKQQPQLQQPTQTGQEQFQNQQQEKPCQQDKVCTVFLLQDMNVSTTKKPASDACLTFITSNPLIIYDEIHPRIARVAYTFMQDKKESSLFKLVRTESNEIDYQRFQEQQKSKKIHGYDVLNNIHTCTISCKAQEQPKQKNPPLQPSTKPTIPKKEAQKPPEFESFTTWNADEREKEKKRLIPEYIIIKGTLKDPRKKREVPFEFIVPIIACTTSTDQQQTPSALRQELEGLIDKLKQSTQKSLPDQKVGPGLAGTPAPITQPQPGQIPPRGGLNNGR